MSEQPGTSAVKAETAPHADDPRKPDAPPDLTKPSWKYTAKRAWSEFSHDQCTDLAAALTYYSVLALFPALVALVSLLGVVGQGESTVNTMVDLIRTLGSSGIADVLEGPIRSMVASRAAGFGLVVGLAGALWSASGYVAAFSRALNRVYEVDEGRPFVKLRPQQLLLTTVLVVLVAVALLSLVVSGPVVDTMGNALGLGNTARTMWSIVKWPLLLVVVVGSVALLYYATPNVQQPKFRWISVGAAVAILVWVVVSVLFGLYVANFSSYNKTYGSLAGVIVFLLWLWLTNLALLFGAEVDSELERARQLQGGIEAEETLQLRPRDTAASEKAAAKREKVVAQGRALRRSAGSADTTATPSGEGSRRKSARPGPDGSAPRQGHVREEQSALVDALAAAGLLGVLGYAAVRGVKRARGPQA